MTVTEFFENLKNGAVWSAGVAFERTNPLPLDRYSVFESKVDAETYASDNPVAYPGQVVAVISENENSQVFYINETMELEPIGIIPVGEKGAIEIDPKGNVTLHGFQTAGSLTLPRKSANGEIEWVAISEVVQGDGNTVTEGDKKSIDTAGDEKSMVASLHGFKEATDGQVAYKNGDALAWKDEYKYDDAAVKADIQKNTSAISAADKKITALENDLKPEGATGQKIAALEAADVEINAALAERPTTSEVATQISEAAHLKRLILTSESELPAVKEADENTIYMVPKAAKTLVASASDTYVEYMAINGKWEIIGDTTVDLKDYAKVSTVTALSEKVDGVSAVANAAATKASFEEYKTSNDQAVGSKASQESLNAVSALVEKKLDAETASATYATKNELDNKLDASEISKYQTTANAKLEKERLDGVNTRLETAESEIDALQQVGAEKNVINSASEEFTVSEGRELSVKAISQEKITGLSGALAGKVDSADGQRLMTDEEGAKLTHITVSQGTASFDGKVEVANVNGLDTHITEQRDTLAGLLSADEEAKLSAIDAGAQVNKIESIKVEGSQDPLAINDKAVTLPKATAVALGLVKLSDDIGVDEQGALSIKKVNCNTLVQNEGDTLLLDGGSSTKNWA